MSYRCIITLKPDARLKGQPAEQASPLRFATAEEAQAFGRVMFEPPESVESWKVEQVEQPANYSYKNGKLALEKQGGKTWATQ
jgi:hypothetical protein